MIISTLIAFFSLIGLLFFHELGHFILAKKFKVKVDEFGFGYPPRLFGKKIGQTLYSLNLLPFGGFVRIYGEEEQSRGAGSFFEKPIYQRALIVLGGVFSFWLISWALLSFAMALGAPTAIEDEAEQGLVNPKVQIINIAADSPAHAAELRAGDVIVALRAGNDEVPVTKIKQVQEFNERYKGKTINIKIARGKDIFEKTMVPRISPPPEQGALGVVLVRTAVKSYPWYLAGFKGLQATANLSILLVRGWVFALKNLFIGEPSGIQLMGPVGLFGMFQQMSGLGLSYFLNFTAMISLHLAFLNLLPIPALDGGKLLFLLLEKIKGRPVEEKIEKYITACFFALLVLLMILVTIKDIIKIF